MKALFNFARPFLHALDPEDAHKLTIEALKRMPICSASAADPMLEQNMWGLSFRNPLGLAAGFDKTCGVTAPIIAMGFSFTEVGTVTPRPQAGNPRPRVFRDSATQAVINRMGFPNPGADVFFTNLARAKKRHPAHIIGVNIGKNKDTQNAIDDYKALAQRAAGLADYLVINISSPNTPGLRDLQNGAFVTECAAVVRTVYNGPVLVKLAPDLDENQLADLCAACLTSRLSGVILTNTTLDRPAHLDVGFAAQAGGLSGKPIAEKSKSILRAFYQEAKGQMPLIAAGGIASAKDAYERILCGATLVQLYTALVFGGPAVVHDIVSGLPALLRRDGFKHVSQAVGMRAR